MADKINNSPLLRQDEVSNPNEAQKEEASGSSVPKSTDGFVLPHKKRLSGAALRRRARARAAANAVADTASKNSSTGKGANTSIPTLQANKKTMPRGNTLPGTNNNKKRVRSSTSTPSPISMGKRAKPVAPTPPSTHGISYGEAIKSHLRVAIINRTNLTGKLEPDQAGLVQAALNEELDKNLFSSDKLPLHFYGWSYAGEILRISCRDDTSLNWLNKTVLALKPLWEGAKLEVRQADKLIKLTKVRLWIPGAGRAELTTQKVIQRLATQNPDYAVKEWCVFHSAATSSPGGLLLIVGVPEPEAERINSEGGRIYHGFDSIKFVNTNSSKREKSEEDASPPSEDSPSMEQMAEASSNAASNATTQE